MLRCAAVWLVVSAVMDLASGTADTPNWEEIFRNRNDEDWARVWHVERHRRCYHQLVSHMNLVCREDIYKLSRRRRDVAADKDPEMTDLFLKPEAALGVLTGKLSKRRVTQHNIRTRSIIDECCDTEVGCSWEEYAEYCPANRRMRNRKR
uniref:Insulin-like peptide 5 n=1 Tax=Ixodes scapularis TaxID=6945 RepID=A0A4Y5T748_IXOSC|nr:insulin-like peptide 5 [Ixodes scapularis]